MSNKNKSNYRNNRNNRNVNNNKQRHVKRRKIQKFNQANFAKLLISEMSSSSSGRRFLKRYTQSEVRDMIENYQDERNQRQLVEISRMLYVKSNQYKRLINYFSDMLLFPYFIVPNQDISNIDRDKAVEQYYEISMLVDKMKLKHEMRNVLRVSFVEDVFYGYIHMDKNDFYIQKIDSSLCKITHVEDGVYNFSIDMSYFEANEERLVGWAKEIQLKYEAWKKEKKKNRQIGDYVELSVNNTICIKLNEELREIIPPFVGTFDSIFDIDAFKQLRKNKEELNNYMALVQKLPIRTNTDDINDFLIDEEFFRHFHNMVVDIAPDNVGVVTSPMDIDFIRFDKDKVDSDGVAKAERDFWAGSGTSQSLFSVDKNSNQGILLSIKTDEEIVFSVLAQIERWLNRFIKNHIKNTLYTVKLMEVTHFNQKEVFERLTTAGNNGVPVRTQISAVVGMSPVETINMLHLENDILNLDEKFIPLQTSHTQSGNDKGGRPEKDADELTDEGIKSRDKKIE